MGFPTLHRFWRWLDSAAALRRALWLAPLMFGLLSLRFGQDDNWDLHNYHLYSPFALLHGKIGYDLGPAQWQSYFNPTLDLLYYGLIMNLPARLVGFLMGALHGLNFTLLALLGRGLLPAAANGLPPFRLILLLALAGCMGPSFVSQLATTMGDNTTALLVLGALLLLLRRWPLLRAGGRAGAWAALAAGLLMGAAAGLKLTNAVYALALCLALLALDSGWRQRWQAAVLYGFGVLGGIAVTAGHWYWRMWEVFGNPLFPQFNNLFHGPLALPIGVGDAGWLPRSALEKWLWPFIITLDPRRVCELPLRHLIWPMLYLAFAALALLWLGRLARRRPSPRAMTAPVRMLLLFTGLSYLIWLHLFSIYRYLGPLELLAPMLFWLLMAYLLEPDRARGWSRVLLLIAACSVLSSASWSRARWGEQAYDVATPVLPQPEQNMVLMLNVPMGWLVPFFPDRLAFVSLGAGFPESPAYVERVHAMMARRSGPFYAMLAADAPPIRDAGVQPQRQRDGAATLARYGLLLDTGHCTNYLALLGRTRHAYQLCPVQPALSPPRDSRTR
jgi:hypothetical protein